ncbi:RNA-binding protein 26 [Daphnia magna]|uniref:RNA-binding protein 26 n=1 Tax=Daphnia magna TaxID=35525 RepID=UPI001E1BB5DE|nr:RNA-binding protein 26 [Daphnia magna]
MIIENPEALKSWLTAVLAPLCDADPAALAKYVLALAKKEKPESELRGAMCDQLDVFLQQETKGFVDKLFVTLETKSYLQSNPEPPSTQPESASSTTEQANTGVTNGQNLVIPPVSVPVVPLPVPVLSATSADSRTKKSSSDRTKRRSWSPRSRSRSRSRDRDRDRPVRRSRSRDRSTRDHRGGRSTWDDRRPSRRSPVNSRRSDRRRSRSPLPPRRSSRSPRSSRRQRSPIPPPPIVAGLENVAVAPVLVPTGVAGTDPAIVVGLPVPPAAIQSVVVAPPAAVPQQQLERGPKFRCRDYDEKGYCMRGDLCPYDHGTDPVVLEDVELSSVLNYNRPPPPVGATGSSGAPPGPLPVGPPPHLRGPPPSLPPSGEPYNPDAPGISWPPPPLVGLRPLGPPPPFGHPPSHRLPPPHMRIRGPLPPRGPPPMGLLGSAPPPRELINVPTAEDGIDAGVKRTVREAGLDSDGHLVKKGHFDYNRLGNPPVQQQQQQQQQQTGQANHGQPPQQRRFDPTNCCLEVKKIPRGLNNISVLNNHFSKFGKIINLQVSYNGDSEGALVTFSSHAEAQAAYRSTEAVLNNRFIKVFWHNKEMSSPEMKGKQENVPPTSKVPIRERLGGAHPQRVLAQSQTSAAIVDEVAIKEASEAKEKEREKAVAAIKRSQEILAAKEALKKKQEEQKREATKLQVDLQRRKQELLDKQLQQQRVLIERLEKNKNTIKTDERAAVMQTVRNLQETIEKLKKDLQTTNPSHGHAANAPSVGAPAHLAKTPEEAKKEILDVEIELYQKQMEGSDTTELQRRVQELNSIISQSHRGHPSNRRGARISSRGTLRGRGRGLAARLSARGRGRGGYYVGPHVSVDRRPTQLKATGFEIHQQGDILAHFANFGEVVDYHVDEDYPALTIRYKSRKDAEMALAQGRSFTGANLSVSWHMPPGSVPKVKDHVAAEEEDEHSGNRIEGSASAEEDDEEENEGLDDLLNYEEDDEDEERSWRR